MSAQLTPRPALRAMNTRDLHAVLAIESGAYSFPWTRGNFIDSLAAGYLAQVLEQPGAAHVPGVGQDEAASLVQGAEGRAFLGGGAGHGDLGSG